MATTPSIAQLGFEILPGYTVTRDGKVFSISQNWRGYGIRQMKARLNSDGYPIVRLLEHGRRRTFPVHKLVATCYLPPRPSPSHQVRHLDGDKTHCHASNLAWGTVKENANDRERHGRTSRGEAHSTAIRKGLGKL